MSLILRLVDIGGHVLTAGFALGILYLYLTTSTVEPLPRPPTHVIVCAVIMLALGAIMLFLWLSESLPFHSGYFAAIHRFLTLYLFVGVFFWLYGVKRQRS